MAKNSLDEGRDASHFNDKTYKRDFIQQPEVKNTVASVMSAMVSQIDFENNASNLTGGKSKMEESTEPETLDDLFDNFQREIAYDNNLMDREFEEQEFEQRPIKGVLPSSVEVFDTLDTSNQPITLLP